MRFHGSCRREKHYEDLGIITALYCALVVSLGFSGEAQGETITFNDEASLAALSYTATDGTIVKAAKFTFAGSSGPNDTYVEKHMTFREGVVPRDPRLLDEPQGHYHLGYEDPEKMILALSGRLPDPENQSRALSSHGVITSTGVPVIQMTFDNPNQPGNQDRFNLLSIVVLSGKLDIGIEFQDGSIGIYNGLTPGHWNLLGANNLIRATLEFSFSSNATVDDIEFTPAAGPLLATLPRHPNGDQRTKASPPFLDHTTISFLAAELAPPPKIDILPRDPTNLIDPKSERFSVAILTTKGFDATRVDPRSVDFGTNGVKAIDHAIKGKNLILRFSTEKVGFRCEDSGKEFLLFGKTLVAASSSDLILSG